jgi:hypothetical protein
MSARSLTSDLTHPHSDDSQPFSLNSGYNLTDQAALHAIRFDHYECLFHLISPERQPTYVDFVTHLTFLGTLLSLKLFWHFDLQK